MYSSSDKPLDSITLDLPQFFNQDDDTALTSVEPDTKQEAAISQLLDIWIDEFERLYMTYVEGGNECQSQQIPELMDRQSYT